MSSLAPEAAWLTLHTLRSSLRCALRSSLRLQEWLDVPMRLVGRVIGRKGETIRKICEESGAEPRRG